MVHQLDGGRRRRQIGKMATGKWCIAAAGKWKHGEKEKGSAT
jgi:hypothetical protein